jgi:hypothetical protein
VLDGRDVLVPNRWKLKPNVVALIGRPAVWFALDFALPRIPLGFTTIPARKWRWEQDFGGHLFVAVTSGDASQVLILEGGPSNANGTGALVPFRYPEDVLAEEGLVDFPPIVVPPPNGLSEETFAELLRAAQKSYDGDQRYVAIQIPFLRVGRDSNSYAAAILLSGGIDSRALPKPRGVSRYEWTGYPGLADPVHRSSFGIYIGAPTHLPSGAVEVAHHDENGDVRYVVVGGEPNGRARLPDGAELELDALGRIVLSRDEARKHNLPTAHTEPPPNIRTRRRFPKDPAPAGGLVTLILDGTSIPLEPGNEYRGLIVDRLEAITLATMRAGEHDVVLPVGELGGELRDPKRVDALFRVGNELTVGLDADRYPKLIAHGATYFEDRLRPRRLHLPNRTSIVAGAFAVVAGAALVFLWRRRPL